MTTTSAANFDLTVMTLPSYDLMQRLTNHTSYIYFTMCLHQSDAVFCQTLTLSNLIFHCVLAIDVSS